FRRCSRRARWCTALDLRRSGRKPAKAGTPTPGTPRQAANREPPSAACRLRKAASGGLILEPTELLLSLCMIVRDNARTLAAALTSIRPWVDEMVVVDTGSTDATPRLAARLGARVEHFAWCDSFAAARNESLKYARGQWVFWTDSDDTIDAANGRKL